MSTHRTVTIEELEMLSPDERRRLHEERLITDAARLPPEFLAAIRENARALAADNPNAPVAGR